MVFEIPRDVFHEELPALPVPSLNSADIQGPDPEFYMEGEEGEKGFHFFYEYPFLNFLIPLNLTQIHTPGVKGTEEGAAATYTLELKSNRFRVESDLILDNDSVSHTFNYMHYFTGPSAGVSFKGDWNSKGLTEGFLQANFLYESWKERIKGEVTAGKESDRSWYTGELQAEYRRNYLLDLKVRPLWGSGDTPVFSGHFSTGWKWEHFLFMPGVLYQERFLPYGDISLETKSFLTGVAADEEERAFIYWKKKQRDLSFKSGILFSEESVIPFISAEEDFFFGVRRYYISRDHKQVDFSFINPAIQSIIALSYSWGTEKAGEISLEWTPSESTAVQTGIRWFMDIQKINYTIEISFSS